jgi:hexokinase
VAVDGSVYRYHPFFHDLMTERIKNLLNPELERDFNLILSQDGSGRGAALVAAVACRLRS